MKTWFSNARRTRRRKQQAQKTGNTPKPYRKSKFVPKKTKEWKLNKSSVAKNSASQHSCSTTQKEQVPKGKSHGKSHGVGQDKGVQLENQLYLEIFDCSKVKKDDVRTKTEVESNDLCVNETKDIPAVKITNKSNEKSDFPVNDNMDTDVLKETVKTNLKTDMIKLAELERDEKNKMAGSKENERKPMEPRHEKTNVLVPTRSDTNQAVQLQKMARGLKFWI